MSRRKGGGVSAGLESVCRMCGATVHYQAGVTHVCPPRFELGVARWAIMEGDCLAELPRMPQVDHVITDPPYSEHTHAKQWIGAALTQNGARRRKTAHAGLGFDSLIDAVRIECATHISRLVRRWVLAFTDLESIHAWRESFVSPLEYVRTCIWDKVDGAPQFTGDRPASGCEAIVLAHPKGKKRWNGGGSRNVFRFAVNGQTGPKPHPSTKPDALMLELVRLFTDPDDLVLDPFAGSGSTGVACLRLGRRFIGVERDPKYAALARRRLEAEAEGNTLAAHDAGQITLFGGQS